jgi:hypothetical protein
MVINTITSLDVDYMEKEPCPFNVNELEKLKCQHLFCWMKDDSCEAAL